MNSVKSVFLLLLFFKVVSENYYTAEKKKTVSISIYVYT